MKKALHAEIVRELLAVHPYAIERASLYNRHGGGRRVAPALRSLSTRGLIEISVDSTHVWLEYPVAEALKLLTPQPADQQEGEHRE